MTVRLTVRLLFREKFESVDGIMVVLNALDHVVATLII